MQSVKIELDHREIKDFLTGPEIESALRDIAEKAASRARATAPVASGAYRDSIKVEVDETDRTAVRVVAHDWKAAIIESRTSNLKKAVR